METRTKLREAKLLDQTGDDAATISGWSDRHPATVVKRTPKTVWVQEDRAVPLYDKREKTEGHGPLAAALTLYEREYDSPIRVYTLRKSGRLVAKGSRDTRGVDRVTLGRRGYYYDPHF